MGTATKRALLALVLLLQGIAYADYKTVILGDTPIIYMRLEENSGANPPGGTAFDTSGNAHNGTFLSAAGTSVDQNQSPAFNTGCRSDFNNVTQNGTQKRIEISDFAASHLGTGNYTIEFWWYMTSGNSFGACSTQGSAISKDIDASGFPYVFCSVSGGQNGPSFQFGSTVFGPDTTLPHGQWNLIDLVRTSTTNVNYYKNGSNSGGITISSSTNATNTSPLVLWYNTLIGAGDTSTYNLGMDEIAIYNYALSGAQISAHYAARNDTDTSDTCTTQLRRRVYQMQ